MAPWSGPGAYLLAVIVAGIEIGPACVLSAQERVSFPTQDGGVIYGDQYGAGQLGVVLAHGGRFSNGFGVLVLFACSPSSGGQLPVDGAPADLKASAEQLYRQYEAALKTQRGESLAGFYH